MALERAAVLAEIVERVERIRRHCGDVSGLSGTMNGVEGLWRTAVEIHLDLLLVRGHDCCPIRDISVIEISGLESDNIRLLDEII